MIQANKYRYGENATPATVQFSSIIKIFYKIFLDTIFVIPDPKVHKAHPGCLYMLLSIEISISTQELM